jgi:23S rRNA pseudouridine2605 synthase
MAKGNFQKFINPAPTGAKKKEKFKQEKRAIKKERAAYFDNVKAEKAKAYKEAKAQRVFFDETKRGIKPKFDPKADSRTKSTTTKPYTTDPKKSTFDDRKNQTTYTETTPKIVKEKPAPGSYKAFKSKGQSDNYTKSKPNTPAKKTFTTERAVFDKEGKPMRKRLYAEEAKFSADAGKKSFYKSKESIENEKQQLKAEIEAKKYIVKPIKKEEFNPDEEYVPKPKAPRVAAQRDNFKPLTKPATIIKKAATEAMPLNKFVAHCGVCSRRDAAELVKSGKILVNNKQVTEPGYKVLTTDVVKFEGKEIKSQNNLVYILLNKPKDFLTTVDDPQGRKTVMDLIGNATPERVYPVGRLDRNTTGVLLFTNDGDLAQKLTHPKHEIKKIYEVKLDKPLIKADAEKILAGVQLEDGLIAPDALAFVDTSDKSIIGIEIHSGKNRIVRRIFEHMGYDVRNLDRVMFANLTKKNVERGRYRFLDEKEVRNLKFLNASKGGAGNTRDVEMSKKRKS